MRHYLSKNEPEFAEFVRNFKYQLDYIADELNLDADEVKELRTAFDEYEKDSTAQLNAKLNYKISVQKKDSSKKTAKALVQKLVRRIKSDGRATDVHYRLLNLPIRDEILTRSKTPEGVPVLMVEIRQHLIHRLEIRNGENMARAKPATATGAEIWCFVGDKKDLTERNLRYLGTATRSKFKVEHDTEDIGKTAHYMARWINRRGIHGEWSHIRSATIAE